MNHDSKTFNIVIEINKNLKFEIKIVKKLKFETFTNNAIEKTITISKFKKNEIIKMLIQMLNID